MGESPSSENHGELFELEANLLPNASALASFCYFDAETLTIVKSDIQVTIWDDQNCNCVLKGERIFVQKHPSTRNYVPRGSTGLFRPAIASEAIAEDATGAAKIVTNESSSLYPEVSPVRLDHGYTADVAADDEIWIKYVPQKSEWDIVQLEPGVSSLAKKVEATLASALTKSTASVTGNVVAYWNGNTSPGSTVELLNMNAVATSYEFDGAIGDVCYAEYDEQLSTESVKKYRIYQINCGS